MAMWTGTIVVEGNDSSPIPIIITIPMLQNKFSSAGTISNGEGERESDGICIAAATPSLLPCH